MRRLTYLRIDAPLVYGFLQLQESFPSLHHLHVDFAWGGQFWTPGSDYDDLTDVARARVYAPCRELKSITLFASHMPIPDADSRRVAILALALGQYQRPNGRSASLQLVEVDFKQPVAHRLLESAVSHVHGPISRAAFSLDDAMWRSGVLDMY